MNIHSLISLVTIPTTILITYLPETWAMLTFGAFCGLLLGAYLGIKGKVTA